MCQPPLKLFMMQVFIALYSLLATGLGKIIFVSNANTPEDQRAQERRARLSGLICNVTKSNMTVDSFGNSWGRSILTAEERALQYVIDSDPLALDGLTHSRDAAPEHAVVELLERYAMATVWLQDEEGWAAEASLASESVCDWPGITCREEDMGGKIGLGTAVVSIQLDAAKTRFVLKQGMPPDFELFAHSVTLDKATVHWWDVQHHKKPRVIWLDEMEPLPRLASEQELGPVLDKKFNYLRSQGFSEEHVRAFAQWVEQGGAHDVSFGQPYPIPWFKRVQQIASRVFAALRPTVTVPENTPIELNGCYLYKAPTKGIRPMTQMKFSKSELNVHEHLGGSDAECDFTYWQELVEIE